MTRRRSYYLVAGIMCLLAATVLLVFLVYNLLQPRLTGTLLVLLQTDDGPRLHQLSLATGEVEPFGGLRLGDARYPVFAPDRQQAVFAAAHHIENGLADMRIYVIDRDDAEPRQLTSGPLDGDPQWSPDGKQIVFVRSINFFSALFMVDVVTGEERQLTDYTNDLEPDWSPDGGRIVFTTSRDGFQELYTMSPDGSDLHRLTENENQNDLEAAFSPDGTQIAYMTNYSVGDGTGEIWVMNADGSDQRRLTDNRRDDRLPVWSPDGRKIAFTSTLEDRSGTDVYLYDLDTDELRLLTHQPGHNYGPTWSPDGEWVGYVSRQQSGTHLYAAHVASGDIQPLLVDDAFRATFNMVWLP
jgi:TolB protein